MGRNLPTGTVTFLFTDIEGSTGLLHELGPERYAAALLEHRRLLRETFERHGGVEVDTEGDAFFVAFPDPDGAVSSAADAQAALAAGPIRVRIGLHTGTPHVTDQGYVGVDVHKGARIAASAHGGQVILSKETRQLLGERLEFLDLGEHRVKDFSEPVWIYQLGSEHFPPLKTISNTNLPRPASSFVGREHEVAAIRAMLTDGARFVTLTGPGGTGKTRLAIEAAAELIPAFRNGVFWVGLAALRDPALVPETIGQTIGAKDDLAESIGDRELLLVLDNLEQITASASGLASLVEACPNLRLLTTSRERLRVRGEVEVGVPPLSDPEAVALFCARSGLDADDAIANLCRRLDDLPLAVELAAARTAILTPAQILERLGKRLDLLKGGRDADPRQATLRATIEWSHGLLTPDERTLFAGLSVFRGGWTLDAAEAVTDADLDVLHSLVDKSLVRRAGERFLMLETVREFAAERMEGSGDAEQLRRRHTEYFVALAEEAYPNLKGDPKPWLDRLETDHDNLRAALDGLESAGRTQEALQLAGALYRLWYMRGYLREGRDRLERLLDRDLAGTAARVRALHGAAVMASTAGDPQTAERRAEEARDLARELGDAWGEAYGQYMIATVATERKDWSAARRSYESSLEAFRGLGDDHYELLAMDGIAWTTKELGDRERARRLHEQTLMRARASGDDSAIVLQLFQLADFAVDEGRTEEALAMLREALVLSRDEGRPESIVEVLVVMARTLRTVGAQEVQTRLLAAAARLREEIGGGSGWVGEEIAEQRAQLGAELGDDAFGAAWAEGRRFSTDEAIALALSGLSSHTAAPHDG